MSARKTETTAVHADHRDLRGGEIARHAEQAAVAANDDQQVADRAKRFPLFDPMRAFRQHRGGGGFQTRSRPFRARRNCSSVTTDSTMLRLPLRAISPTVLKVM
jgi:hypothetical protein